MEAPLAETTEEATGPPLGLQFDPDALLEIRGLDERVAEWERLHLKDGVKLTTEERLVLVAHLLTLRGFSPERISYFIGAAFFGVTGTERQADNLSTNQVHLVYATPGTPNVLDLRNPVQGTARVVFTNGASTSFTGPTKYSGLDTNDREQQVGLARNSYRSNGHRAGYRRGGESMIDARLPELRSAFMTDEMSLDVRDQVGTPAYRGAFNDFIYDRVLNSYAEKVAAQNVPLLQAWIDDNPAPGAPTQAWVQQLATRAMQLVLGYNNANIFARRHLTWFVEDEAAAQILVEQVLPGVTVNFDADTPSNIQVQ